ncbi:MAG: hypothetical protein WA005_18205 [Candidatus Binataceae bacterium]
MANSGGSISLPKGLELVHIRKAVDFIEKHVADLVELYFEQANVFSGVVGIFGVRALDSLSPYKRHKHPDVAQQRFPDLSLNGKLNPPPQQALESKASTRPWAIQSHYDHPGWYIVWRYLVDPTQSIKEGHPAVIWRVDVVFIQKSDWKYEGSTASSAGGGRTHTFGLRRPADKLRGMHAYLLPNVKLKNGKPVLTATR